MKKIFILGLLIIIFLANISLIYCSDDPNRHPQIRAYSPKEGTEGTEVILTVTNTHTKIDDNPENDIPFLRYVMVGNKEVEFEVIQGEKGPQAASVKRVAVAEPEEEEETSVEVEEE